MAGESSDRRARARRERQANVPGGREHSTLVRMSAEEKTALMQRAAEAGVSVPRLMVESALSSAPEAGRAHAVMQLLELDTEIRRIGANLNQLTRYAHQERELPEHLDDALHAVVRACLSVDATARWVMGLAPAVTAVSVDTTTDLAVDEEWAAAVDPDTAGA
ncbi:MobC family plasmid mobilization relaxosome protein [Nocardia gipuzkoensis]|uniref:MobC family plasmid mobilization relaxosome protein n=1 Tax=Nocardia gipuzkoensis TaxID=2749991 RepID=UPI003B8A835D